MAGIINFNNYASKYYIKGEKWTQVPFSKFQWTISFLRNDGSSTPEELTYIAKTVDLPGWDIQQQTLNQYNKKRVVNTSIVLKPVSINFLDTIDGKFRTFIQEYMNGFSTNFSQEGAAAIELSDQLSDSEGFNSSFGITAVTGIDDNFLKKIIINQEHGGEVWSILLVNPKITSVSHDQLDYSQSTGFVTWTITVQPEAVVHETASKTQPDYEGESKNKGNKDNPDSSQSAEELAANTALGDWNEPGYSRPSTVNSSDLAINGLDLRQTSGAIASSMNNISSYTSKPTAALYGIQNSIGGSIPSGVAINASSMANGMGRLSNRPVQTQRGMTNPVSSAMSAVSQVTGIAYALTQIPGLRKYTKGPIADIAKTGIKLRSVNNAVKSAPAALSGLQRYINGVDPRNIGGKWL